MNGPRVAEGTLGYDRALEWKEPPSPEESALCGWSVVRAAGRPAARWLPVAHIGGLRLYLAPPGTEADAVAVFCEPVVAGKRGTPARGGYVGVDGHVRTGAPHPAPFAAPFAARFAAPDCPPPPVGTQPRTGAAVPGAVRVAVIDTGFENLDVLRPFDMGRIDGPYPSSRVWSQTPSPLGGPTSGGVPASLSRAPGHGTAMAGIILHQMPGARVGLFRISSVAGAVPAYAGPTEIAVAVAEAVASWHADVVLIAMSDGAWGTPRHLREVLREAARTGRHGRGTPIVCSVGDPAKNHAHAEDSAALGADDLASQPWVLAIAACDAAGRWQRAAFEYHDASAPGATYNRLGPAVALAAPGEARRYGGVLAADDSSQAAALAAAAAARVLQASPATTVDELRAILNLTADVAGEIDGGRGLAAAVCPGRDRLGHSFKVGYGTVNAAAAALAVSDPIALAFFATRPLPDPPPGMKSFAQHLAEAWEATWPMPMPISIPMPIAATASPEAASLVADYARVRGALARVALRSLAVGEALAWLARHVRAIGETDGSTWFSSAQDHGALVDRLSHAVDVLGRALGHDNGVDDEGDQGDQGDQGDNDGDNEGYKDGRDADRGAAVDWLDRFAAVLASCDSTPVAAIVGAVLRRALAARGDRGDPDDLQTNPDFSSGQIRPAPAAAEAAKDQPCPGKALPCHGRRGGDEIVEARS